MAIKSETWESFLADSGVSPHGSGGWNGSTAFKVYSAAYPHFSGNNVLVNDDDAGSHTLNYTGANDGAAGLAKCSQIFRLANAAANNNVQILCRSTTPMNNDGDAGTTYRALAMGATGIRLDQFLSGTGTVLAGPIGDAATLATGIWYYMQLVCETGHLKVRIQRQSDNQWLSAAGTWVSPSASFPDTAATVWCIDYTGTQNITGAGNAGLRINQTATAAIILDNFEFDTVIGVLTANILESAGGIIFGNTDF